ncbi:helix-turn-helix domain-containing protein [Clostridium sp. Mt-5]|uniref:Helix-turn-helix domain-containing protein n=1 Tax=Clostridium moutaii TaxID=3240932 RepID=A0ABV4BVF0_9CLOT
MTEIALSCGFSNIIYFTRFYKESKNISPLKFRKGN